jgi:hypothetical protein
MNNVEPFDMRLRLRNVGIGAAFNIHVEYSIKGIKNSKQMEMIRDIEHNNEAYIWLVQNGRPLQHDKLASRVHYPIYKKFKVSAFFRMKIILAVTFNKMC